jgi:hypothetical protein
MTITDRDVEQQVRDAVQVDIYASRADIDVSGVAAAIIERYGLVDIDDVPSDEFWGLVEQHDQSA